MTRPAAGSAGRPVSPAARVDGLDVLRGFALLGILAVNIQLFAMPAAAYFNPTVFGDLEGANFQVWLWTRLLGDQKFMTIFAMLFGAGIVLMASRAGPAVAPGSVHYRRMRWLALCGLLHGHLLWGGDILFLYAVCGMLVYPLRGWSPRRLLVVGTATLGVASAISMGGAASLPAWPAEARAGFIAEAWQPTPAMLAAELAAYRGGWLDQLPVRSAQAFGFETLVALMLQTVICTTIFYGHGLGYYGAVDRLGQLGVVAGVWVLQLVASPLWLRRYRFGPAEWVWRSLTYGTRPVLRCA